MKNSFDYALPDSSGYRTRISTGNWPIFTRIMSGAPAPCFTPGASALNTVRISI